MKRMLFTLFACWLPVAVFASGTGALDIAVVNASTTNWAYAYSWTRDDGASAGKASANIGAGATAHITDNDGSGYTSHWTVFSRNPALGASSDVAVGTFDEVDGSPTVHNTYTVNVFPSAPPTNCADHVAIFNPNPLAAGYQLYKNGIGAGVIYVAGGQTASLSFDNPSCANNSYTYAQVAGGVYVDSTQPGGQSGNGWAFSPTGGYDAPLLNGPAPAPTTTTSAAGTNGLPGPVTGTILPDPPAPFTNNISQANTNGPISFGTNTVNAPTNAANNGVIQQTGNALYTATVNSGQAIVDAIKELDAANRRGHAGTSNLLQTVTNELRTVTNELGTLTNQLGALTNEFATNSNPTGLAYALWSNTIATITNTVAGALSPMTNTWGGMIAGLNTNPLFGTPADSYTFALPSMPDSRIAAPPVVVSLPAVQAIQPLSAVKGVVAWVILLGWFYQYCRHAEWAVQRLFSQRQLQGNKQMVEAATFGGNVSVVTALVYAGIFAAVIGILPTVVAAFTSGLSSQANSFMGNITAISSWPVWSFVNAVCPLELVIFSFLNYLVFRFIVCDMLLWVLLGIIFAMAE